MKKWMSACMAVAFVFTLLLMPQQADACSCMPPSGPAEEMEKKEFVFSGTVTEIVEPAEIQSSGDPVAVHFDVDTVWKGEIGAQTEVSTPFSSATCGFYFEVGQAYIVYGSVTEEGTQQVVLCSRTAPLEQATEDLSVLGEGVKPGEEPPVEEPPVTEPPVVQPPVAQPTAVANGGISIHINGQPLALDVAPMISNGVTYVPVRAAEAFAGVQIEGWDSQTKSVTIRHESGLVLTLRAGGPTVQDQSLAAGEPVIVDGRVMVPVRFIAESFGWTVGWDAATKTVKLDSPAQ
ncbi:stalk domain-containing protein [Paenibacillus daejeonensis]|uniref:stalk domain-containing protein n=1 Tax=Paenibacillus daejeonensis TaxID=135193 RepID=UPI00037F48AB|nr:stalk domain-containing protein [Paenibacillus daejeonensis]